jgi:hypothetical protein
MFGFILIALGAYMVFKMNYFGVVSMVVGLPMLLASIGIQIDFDNKSYREFYGLSEIRFGKWQQLPPIDYVTIYIEHYAQRGSVASIDNVSRYSKIKVSLIISPTQRFDAGFFDSKEKAVEAGKMIARNFNTRLLDYTDKEPKWVEL